MHHDSVVFESKTREETLRREPAYVGLARLDATHAHVASLEEKQLHGIVYGTFKVRLESEQSLATLARFRGPTLGDNQRRFLCFAPDFGAGRTGLIEHDLIESIPAQPQGRLGKI